MNLFRHCLLGVVGLLLAGPARAQSYHIDLKTEKLTVPAGTWRITRVLDLRPDRSRLGAVRKGISNEVVSADFAQPLASTVLTFIQTQLPPGPQARPVTMRVFTLAVAEDLRTNSEGAEAELVADFLEPQSDSSYRVLLSVGETTQRRGLDATKFHAANVAQLLQQGLQQLAAVPATMPAAEVLSHADALAGRGGGPARRFPILTADKPKRGFYRSIQEFRDNAPSEADYAFAFERVAHTGWRWAGVDDVQPFYLETDPRHGRRSVGRSNLWGISDGNDMLIVYRNSFYKLLPGSNGFTFMGPPLFDEERASTVVAAGAVGGLVGAAIAGAATGAGPMARYSLNLASGRVVPMEVGQIDASAVPATPDTARIYVYRHATSPKDRVATLSAPGLSGAPLLARQWLKLNWTDRRQEIKVCVQLASGPNNCHEFVPDFKQPNYLEVVVPADGGPAVLRPVSAKEGAFEVRRIRMLTKSEK